MSSLRQTFLGWSTVLWEPSIGIILVGGIGIRLVLIPWFIEPFNFWAGFLSSKVLIGGNDPFTLFASEPRFQQLGPWPYPAEYFLFALGSYLGSDGVRFLYPIWVRLPNVVADAGTAILLFRISRILGWKERQARTCATLYILNPFTILISAIWGTNDPIPVLFSVLALYFFLRKKDHDVILGAFSIGLGIATKLYPVLFLPVVLASVPGMLKKLRAVAVAAFPPLLTSAPFLLSNGQTYLGTVYGFAGGTSGLNRGQLEPQFTTWRVVDWFLGPLDSRLAFVAAGALVVGLFATYLMVQRRRMDQPTGCAFVVLLAYLLAVRWSPNYFMWAMPFVAVLAARSITGWRRWLALGFWAPALVYVLIFNGWYPDPYSGGSGLTYWLLFSGFPGIRVFEAFPAAVAPELTLASVFAVACLALTLLRPLRSQGQNGSASTEPNGVGASAMQRAGRVRSASAIAIVVFIALFAASVIFQSSNHRPVGPADFADFSVLSNGTFSLSDDFHADILSFRWVFQGTGRYVLHPNSTSGIMFDTGGPNGTAYVRNTLSAERVSTQVTFRWSSFFGAEPLVVMRANASRLDVLPAGGMGGMLRFVDGAVNRTYDLGTIGPEWNTVRFIASPAGQVIEAFGTNFGFPSRGPIESIDIGHTEPYPSGGGRLIVGDVAIQWNASPEALRPVSPEFVLALDAGALALLPLLPRILKRLELHGINRN